MVSGVKHKLIKLPDWWMMLFASGFLGIARLTGRRPPITPAFVRRYIHNWAVSCEKARKELGYRPLTIEEGLIKTIEWIKS